MTSRTIKRLPIAVAVIGALAAIFATPALALHVNTQAATEVSATQATLNATIYPDGGSALTGFEYGTTKEYGSQVASGPAKGWGAVNVSKEITDLQPETTYHFRVVAVGGGVAYGSDVTFTTLPGLYMSGHQSENESEQPALNGTSSKMLYLGELADATKFTWFDDSLGQTATCGTTEFMGVVELPTRELAPSLASNPGSCEFLESPGKVRSNGCAFTLTVANSGPPYSGSVENLSCPQGSPGIEVSVPEYCTVTIPPQEVPNSAVSYYDEHPEEEGELSAVDLSVSGSGLEFEKSGLFCFVIEGTQTSFSGKFWLMGVGI